MSDEKITTTEPDAVNEPMGEGTRVGETSQEETPPLLEAESADSQDREEGETIAEDQTPADGSLIAEEIAVDKQLMGLRIEAIEGPDGWHWMLFAANGKPLCTNVDAYKSHYEIKTVVKRVKAAVAEAQLFIRLLEGEEDR
jgi:hypothetical protein